MGIVVFQYGVRRRKLTSEIAVLTFFTRNVSALGLNAHGIKMDWV